MDGENRQQQEPQQQEPQQKEPQQQAIDYDKLASILDGRQKATEESVLKGYFRDQNMTPEQMAEAIKGFKDVQAAKQPDVGAMQAQIDELRKSMEQADAAARVAKVENAVIVEAAKMGIDPKAIPYLTRMADLSDVGEGGEVSAEKVAAAISKVLDDIPALKPQASEQAGFKVGGEGEKKPEADQAKLKAIFGVK